MYNDGKDPKSMITHGRVDLVQGMQQKFKILKKNDTTLRVCPELLHLLKTSTLHLSHRLQMTTVKNVIMFHRWISKQG